MAATSSHSGSPALNVVITGASSGIGLEFARAFAAQGHRIVAGARRKDILDTLMSDLPPSAAGAHLAFATDLRDPHGVETLVRALEANGIQTDILINNAGLGANGSFDSLPWQQQKAMIDVNITALTELTYRLLPTLRARKGRILNVASTAAFQPGPLMAVYYATKAYVLSFSEALAIELEGSGVSVTCLCPGPTASEFSAQAGMQKTRLFTSGRVPSSREVAEFGANAALSRKGTVIHGMKNQVMVMGSKLSPRGLSARIAMHLQKDRNERT